jgi:predicted P-loop ATPase
MNGPFPNMGAEAVREHFAPEPELILNSKGMPVANVANVITKLRTDTAWQNVVALDAMAAKIMLRKPIPDAGGRKPNDFRPRPMTDADVIKATQWFQHNDFPAIRKETVADGMAAVAAERSFDPLAEHLRSLRWDGVPRIGTWLKDYCRAVIDENQPEAYVSAVGRCWLISAVARALRPGCKADSALVLVGPQGIGKSTAARILAYQWFSDALPAVHSKDAADHLRGVWIVEFGEMATASRADVEELKAFVTRTVERFRPAYGRIEVEYPRRNVFFGTSNRDQFLKDETGNRRFWPVEVEAINAARLEADRDLLWAEAVAAFEGGAQWHLTEEEGRRAMVQQAQYLVTDERAEKLSRSLAGRRMTTTLECCQLLDMKTEKREQMEIAGMLRSLGWVRKSDGTRKFWTAPLTTSHHEGGQKVGNEVVSGEESFG